MKIRNKLLISSSISLILVILILILGWIVYTTSQEINKSLERRTLAQNIIADVSDLNALRTEYVLNPGERPKMQWFSKYESLGQNIKKAEEEWGAVLKDIRLDYTELKPLFSEFVKYAESHNGEHLEIEARLTEQMLVKSQEIVSASKRLSSLATARVLSAAQRMFIVVMIVVVIGIVLIIDFVFVFKSIVNPINQLRQATESLAKRKFETRVVIKTGDEFEQLGESFNRTAKALEKIGREHEEIEKAKTEFIAISSHELRSPMTPMKANLQMLLQNYFGKLNKKQKETLETVLRNTNRLDGIIADLLDISRIVAARLKINPVKTDLGKETKTIVNEMRNYLREKKIEIICNIGKLRQVETDPDKVNQVLRNLIDNAKKFSPKKSKVFVSVELKGKVVQFSVKDQGIGIKFESQKRIFQPFFQLEQTIYGGYKGSGLGLAICKGIIEALGGKIWFESEIGKGTTFYFTIPIKQRK